MRRRSRNGAGVASLSVLLLSLGPALVAEAFLVPASFPSLPIGGLLRPRQPSAPLAVAMSSAPSLGLGFDFGTSGVRINVVDPQTLDVVHADTRAYSEQSATVWSGAMDELIETIPSSVKSKIGRVSVSGTSASVLTSSADVAAKRGPRMYDFSVTQTDNGDEVMRAIDKAAPAGHTVRSATSSLAKVLSWSMESKLLEGECIAHQADFLSARLTGPGVPFTSDWNNMLKFGYDVSELDYPQWLISLLAEHGVSRSALPRVVPPGGVIGALSPEAVSRYGLAPECQVVGGTTDSIAAFIAARASRVGEAVTSLGSTVAIKLLSDVRVDDSDFGVYSHRLGDAWLVGGSSNVGCATLRQQKFSAEELQELSSQIDPLSSPPDGIKYYPLTKEGERYPVYDPKMKPVMTPVPESRRDFLHGILHGIAEVERDGYAVLAKMGASPVTSVVTAGGGSVNPVWTEMRGSMLGVPVSRAGNSDAAYGVALLALGKHMS